MAALTELGVKDLTYRHLAVREMPGSGSPAEMLDAARISAKHIAQSVRDLIV